MTQSLRHTRPAQDDEPFVPAFKAMLRHMGKWVGIPALILLALLLLGAAVSDAETYYCSPTGDWTTGDGSAETPWGALGSTTVTKLETELTAGDTLICNDGDHGAITWSGFDEGAYVTFKAESAAAILDGINLGTGNHYISFSGFTVAYGNISCSTSSPYNSHLTFESITQYSSPNPFATTSDWVDSAKYSGIVMYYTDSLNVFNSTFSNNKNGGLFSIGDSTYVKGCTFDGWYDDGIKLGSNTYFADCIVTNQYDVDPAVHNDLLQIYTGSPPNSNITIERNFFRLHDYDRTSGYSEAQGIFTDEVTTNLIIRNNIVLTNWIAGIFLQDVDGVQIINNTVLPSDIDAPSVMISVGDKNGTADNIYIYNNIAQAVDVTELAGDTYASSNNKLCPDDSLAVLFRDYSTFDFYPASTAMQVINAGVENDSIPDDDIRAIYTRPDSLQDPVFENDIGAYEYGASLSAGEEAPEEPAGDTRTAWYVTEDGAGSETGYDFNNALAIADYGDSVTAGDSVYIKLVTLGSMTVPADTLTYIVTDTITLDGRTALSGWTAQAGGETVSDSTKITQTIDDNYMLGAIEFKTTGDGTPLINYTGRYSSFPCTTSVRFPLSGLSGATVTAAYLSYIPTNSTSTLTLQIRGQSGNTTPITSAATWAANLVFVDSLLNYTDGFTAGTRVTHNVTSIVQQIVNSVGFDDSLRLFICSNGGADDRVGHILDYSQSATSDSLARLSVYTEGGGGGGLLSYKQLTYTPELVYINGALGTAADSADVDTSGEYYLSADNILYVIHADTADVWIPGNIGIDNAGKIGTIVKGGGYLIIKNFNTPLDSLQYISRTIIDSVFEVTGADSLDRMTITNSDTVQYGTGVWTNSLAAANDVQDTTGAGGFHYLTASALESDYTLSGLTSKTPDDEYYGAINYAAAASSTGNTNSWGNDTNSWADKPSWGTAW